MKVPTPITWKLASDRHSGNPPAGGASRISKRSWTSQDDAITVGVLALQGDFLEHMLTLQRLGTKTQEVKLPRDLEKINGLIMPGGESTTMANLLDVFQLKQPLIQKIKQGMPVWGTCAGMILLAKKLVQNKPTPLGLMDITVDRNAYGRQIESFETDVHIKPLGEKPMHATFIRAPKITEIGKKVEILGKLDNGILVAVKQNNMLATAFHPELTADTRLHEYFIQLIKQNLA